jgi:flavin reductase (DIM6/NTAB) family NADH-FMN oxidoreductase RutF
MDPDAKKTALRMIPYGLYVLSAETSDGRVTAATVNWVTQASFQPPLIAVGVKADSSAHGIIKESGSFALSILGKDQQDEAFAFFKPVEREGDTIGGKTFRSGRTGAPILDDAPGFVECTLVETLEKGDHSIFIGEVVEAGVARAPEGRADAVTLRLEDLGAKTFYGG